MKRFLNIVLTFLLVTTALGFITVNAYVPDEYTEKVHELRGVWVSTVYNIDIGQQNNSNPESIHLYKRQYIAILNNMVSLNMNAIFFQVRPANDAFYKSEINPWSRYLIGTEGKDPGWDPLPWLIEEAHKRGIEFHAWLNPYRASMDIPWSGSNRDSILSYVNTLPLKSFARQNPDLLVRGANRVLLNPGEPKVRQHIYDTVDEIINNYNVDAIHFDDYFYNGVDHSEDDATYYKYNSQGLGKKDWRREQVNILINTLGQNIRSFNERNNKNVQFGISPAAMWAPDISVCPQQGLPGGMKGPGVPCWGYYNYHDLYADTRKWVLEEWIDYIVPQNYGPLSGLHKVVTDWWSEQVRGTNVKLYIGLPQYRYTNDSDAFPAGTPVDEIARQLRYNAQFPEVEGIVVFSYKSLFAPSTPEMREAAKLFENYWTRNTLLPAYDSPDVMDYNFPNIEKHRSHNNITLSIAQDKVAKGYAIYVFEDNEPVILDEYHLYNYYNNVSGKIDISFEVDNYTKYKIIIRAYMPNGNVSSKRLEFNFDSYINKHKPALEYLKINILSPAYLTNQPLVVSGKVYDLDKDGLTFDLYFVRNDGRFKDKIYIVPEDNSFEVDYITVTRDSEDCYFELIVFDGTHTEIFTSHRFNIYKDYPLFWVGFANNLNTMNSIIHESIK